MLELALALDLSMKLSAFARAPQYPVTVGARGAEGAR